MSADDNDFGKAIQSNLDEESLRGNTKEAEDNSGYILLLCLFYAINYPDKEIEYMTVC